MNEVQQQVRVATRRLTVQQFLAILPWTLTASLVIAAIGVLIPKLVPLAVIQPVWDWAWMGGAFLAGILLATLITYLRRRSGLQAAMEIDNRFGLKERVASCLALSPQEQETQAGQALMADAMRRVPQLDVSDAFRVQPSRWSWLPACCALLTFGLTLLTDAKPDTPPQAQASVVETKKQVQNSADSLKKRLEERRKEAMEKGLQEAGEVLNKLEQGVDSLAKKSDVDRQKAFVKLNDLAKEVQEKQKQLGDREQIQKQLNSLKDIQQGPADRMAKAIKDGDFKTAISQLKQMKDSLDKGQLSDEEKEKLAQQFAEMKDKLQQLAQSHENAKQEMQKQIDQKIAQGDREAAANLQQKLDKMTQQDRQMNQLEKIAQKLGQCCASMKSGSQSKDGQPGKNGQQGQQGQQSQQANQGQPGQQGQQAKQGQKSEQGQQGENAEASDQLGQLADSLEQMQQEMDQMEMLDDAMSQISQAKQSMNCSKCNGMGCSLCNGQSTASSDAGGKSRGQGKQNGLGEGQGSGARPESESDSDFYDSQVRTQIGRGRSVVAGSTPGPNRAGQAIEEVKSELEAGQRSQDDPLTGQRLPKPQRQLTREYFDAFREGE